MIRILFIIKQRTHILMSSRIQNMSSLLSIRSNIKINRKAQGPSYICTKKIRRSIWLYDHMTEPQKWIMQHGNGYLSIILIIVMKIVKLVQITY